MHSLSAHGSFICKFCTNAVQEQAGSNKRQLDPSSHPLPWPHSSQAWTPAGLPIAPTQTTETTANGLCSPEPAELFSVVWMNGQDVKKPWNTNHYYNMAKAVML